MAFGQNIINIIISAQDKFSKTFQRASISMKSFRKAGIGAGIIGGAIAYGMGKAVIASNKVETGFAKVQTLLEKGQNAQKTYGDFVAKTNIVLGDQGDQISVLDGLYQTISAGITNTADAEKFMAIAAKSAVGGHAQLSSVIEVGTKTMAAFGIKAKDTGKVFDSFAATVKAGQTTMEQLAQAFPTVAGTAGAMGAKLSETEGVFAALTKVMASPENAAVALNAIFTKLINPTTDMEKAMKKLGYENGKAMIKSLGIMGTIKALSGTVGGSTIKLGQMFKNVRAIRAIFPLMGGAAKDAAKSIEITTNAGGLMDKQFKDVTDTTEHKWGAALSNVQNLQVSFGNQIKETLAPILDKLAKVIGWLSDKWKHMSKPMRTALIVFGLMTAAIFLIAAAVAILTAVSSPWLAILFGIAAAVSVIIYVIMNWRKIMAAIAKFAMKVGMEMMLFFQRFADVWKLIWAGITNVFKIAWNSIVEAAALAIGGIMSLMEPLVNAYNAIVGKFGGTKINFGNLKSQITGAIRSAKSELTDLGALRAEIEVNRLARRAEAEKNLAKVDVYIDSVYGVDPDEMAKALQDKLDTKIST